MNRKNHWEQVYTTKSLTDVSWYQPVPHESLSFIKELNIPKDSAIIDVGGGDSLLVDHLIEQGFTDITVLDISQVAIERARVRLGKNSDLVHWIVSDITYFIPARKYDFWHDRATFHFLTTENEISEYLRIAKEALKTEGKIMIGTFSTNGPAKCSGLTIRQYNDDRLSEILKKWFKKIKCIYSDHITPFNTIQHFLFCSFNKIIT